MSDPRNVLMSKFSEPNRYSNFGNVLIQMHIQGFRCHENTVIDFNCPITAFCGLNGTGKSTILQLAAASSKNSNGRYFYLRDFFIVGTLDPNPYQADAKVIYNFWQEERSRRQLTLSRSSKSWSGYKRRPARSVFFAGVGVFLPKIERRDFSVYQASMIQVDSRERVIDQIKSASCKILGRNYDEMHSYQVSCGHRTGDVLVVDRGGVIYSETHMGYGEGRAAYLVSNLEILPDKSLVLIEEPETSLHPSAQHELGKFLIDVSIRKGHQIILTTHSEYLLRGLPSSARIYLYQDAGILRQIRGLTASEATSLMTEGHDKALNILVEDDCAKAIVTEMVRRHDSGFLQTISVKSSGDHDSIRTTMRCLNESNIQVAAVLDGDQNAEPRKNIFKLPGSRPPEKELFSTKRVCDHLLSTYGLNWEDYYAGRGLERIDHHDWIRTLSEHLSIEKQSLTRELARVYAETQDCANLTHLLREAISS
ncbi:ATP-dependent endonuclease [Thermodesulfobacteriota bacterium]